MAGTETPRSAPSASLIVVDPNGARTRVHIDPLPFRIGRQADSELIIRDSRASRTHARIVLPSQPNVVTVPMIAVLGNHDYHSGKESEVHTILSDQGVHMLNGDSCEVHGIGFAGVKGFGGGFAQHTLEPWGEEGIKKFVYEAVEESLKLEKALARLRTERLIVLLHYAPVQQTVEGEPLEIYPFLGSSRLEEPINRYPVSLVFHGHAHKGHAEGRTTSGVPVYNVSMSLLTRAFPDRPPFRVFEVPVPEQPKREAPAASEIAAVGSTRGGRS